MIMAASVKSKAELEQIALAMMMMAGGEGTSTSVGMKTRSSSTRASAEPVSRNGRNRNHDQPGSPEIEENGDDENAIDPTPYSASDLIIKEEVGDEALICAINPMSIQSSPSPASPAESQKSTNSGSGSGPPTSNSPYISASRRIFKPEFKQMVLDAFNTDPDCVGNQRATARKFGIHRRQVQKWLQQLSTGELSFKDGLLENEEVYPESLELPPSKVVSKRSKGARRSNQGVARKSEPSGSTRSSSRQRKSMPLKGGSKSTVIPAIVNPSSSLINLSRNTKQNGGSASATFPYTEGNGNSGGSMFMNMSSLLASAAAAGNLGIPLCTENTRNYSPRDHSPIHNNGRGSPAHSAGGSSGGSGGTNLQNALLLVDELNYLYPYSDFSLLRKALLKEEVTLEKLTRPILRNKSSEFPVNGNGISSDLSQGLRDLRRAAALSPKSNSSEYNTQQTLDIIRQQQEYLKLLQQCGIGNSSEVSGLNLSDVSSNGRLPPWFNPFAAAAAAGLPVPSTSKFAPVNGNSNGRKASSTETSDNHRFASPRVPPANGNGGKAKTVAAALAATRVQSSPHGIGRNFHGERNGRPSQNHQRPAQRRKATAARQPRNNSQMDDDIDPTSMLEVVTSIPSPSNSPRTTSYAYRNNGNEYHVNANQNQGMDLTTTAPTATTTSSTTRLISKAMNKEYSFLNELGLVRKTPEETNKPVNGGYGITHTASLENFVQNMMQPRQKSPQAPASSTSSGSPPASDTNDSERTKLMVIDAFNSDPEISGDARAVARKFGLNVRVVMKWLKEAPSKSSPQSNEEIHNENGWGSDNNNLHSRINGGGIKIERDVDEDEAYQAQNLHKAMISESNNNSPGSAATTATVNKRKNSKPNQICDFTADSPALNGALDMVVPIKKRRVSSPSPTPQDA